MARPREFEEDEAIADAMNVFWDHGYESASIALLLQGMRLTKGSLYKAFSDKKALFLKAMTLYEQQQVAPAVAVLRDGSISDPTERITRVFDTIPSAVRQGDLRGCMLCSVAAGPASQDSDIAGVVCHFLDQMRQGFRAALDPSFGEVTRDEMASLLVTHYVGLRILARAQAPVTILDTSIAALIHMVTDLNVKAYKTD